MRLLLYFFLLIFPVFVNGQDFYYFDPEKDLLIIGATKDYSSALLMAQEAQNLLEIKLDLSNLVLDDSLRSLPLPTDTSNEIDYYFGENGPFGTEYVARGRGFDNGIYISIEYSNAYDGFTKDLFIVVVGSAAKNERYLKATLKTVRIKYPDAYIKTSDVYLNLKHSYSDW